MTESPTGIAIRLIQEEARAAERERCAKIVEGEVYKQCYRMWPQLGDGNRARDSEIVRHCDALAAAIRGHEQNARVED